MPEYTQIILPLAGVIIANYGLKLGRALPFIKKAYKLIIDKEEAKKDGVLTQKEKALLYDDIESLLKEAYSIIKGWLPNKSKQ